MGHVYNELRWLLVAATEWVACRSGDDHGVDHLPVLAMDSALLHARNLYEFWRGERHNIIDVFGHSGPRSDLYLGDGAAVKRAMHRKLFHLDADREFEPLETDDDRLHLRVEEIARDVLARWDDWHEMPEMASLRETMTGVRRASVDQAAHAATRLGIDPVFENP